MIQIHQGLDIVDIGKFREVAKRCEGLIADIFSPGEIEYCTSQKDPFVHFAGRFAAKEACLKALGLGIAARGVSHSLRDIEITRHRSGRPGLLLKGWTATVSRRKKIFQYTVSISHSAAAAVASVMLLGGEVEA